MELSYGDRGSRAGPRNRERRLAVLALLVVVVAAGLGTLGAVFSGFGFII